MANQILPGTYIEVRAEGLIRPGPVTVGNVGVIGTAAKGPVGVPVILSSFSDAKHAFYDYDAWVDGTKNELTLVRALEQAFNHGASTVFAVRIASNSKTSASFTMKSASGDCVKLMAKTEGTWGNDLLLNIAPAADNPFIANESHSGSEAPMTLKHIPVKAARNRVTLHVNATNTTRPLQIIYDADPGPSAGQVKLNTASGVVTFFAGEIQAADKVTISYVAPKSIAVDVTFTLDQAKEVFTVVSGDDLISQINDHDRGSAWVSDEHTLDSTKAKAPHQDELPNTSSPVDSMAKFTGGIDGANASAADYQGGLDAILNEEAHIIVAAGQDDSFGPKLDQHCQNASTDSIKHDRIGVIGSTFGASVDDLRGHNLDSDRIIFVSPGIMSTDAASKKEVKLPGAYTAAAIAGLLSSLPAHFSPTNKPLAVDDLQHYYTNAELEQLIEARVLAVERRSGFRIVKGITTSDGPFKQITTRRIVDYAKFGVRAAADPFIGLLNNERVRTALKTSINSFLAQMVKDEMLITYDLGVTATRDEQIQGIASVTMTLQAVFSIDFIKVTMFLE
jgi:Phage tail sheath protein subtilisin-like domain/Phage tail sheath C-terminal domain